jgi:L-amino acid N-acyltransferase YncA
MLIRHADPNRDAAACASIYGPFVADTAISLEEQPPTNSQIAERIERTSATHPWLVAELEDETVGFAYGSPHRERACYRWAADVTVYVSPAAHRRGVGKALYDELLALLARQGVHVACAGITLPNEASVRLHEAVGFVRVGVYRRIGFKQGAWRDVGWWQLQLLPETDHAPAELGSPVGAD